MEFKSEKLEWQTVLGYVGKTRFSLFFYDYKLLTKLKKFLGINIADIKDIAPMKLLAISDRETKRDFKALPTSGPLRNSQCQRCSKKSAGETLNDFLRRRPKGSPIFLWLAN